MDPKRPKAFESIEEEREEVGEGQARWTGAKGMSPAAARSDGAPVAADVRAKEKEKEKDKEKGKGKGKGKEKKSNGEEEGEGEEGKKEGEGEGEGDEKETEEAKRERERQKEAEREKKAEKKKKKQEHDDMVLQDRSRFLPLRAQLFFSFLLNGLSVALAISSFFLWNQPVGISRILDSWSAAPISNISLVLASDSCPAGFETLESLFPGNKYLCDCGANNIKLASCAPFDSTCTTISASDAFSLSNWRYFKFCVQRYPAGSPVTGLSRRGHCGDSGWKNCTSGADPICVPEEYSCPLTGFSVSSGGPDLCPEGSEAVQAFPGTTDPRYLCYSRDGEYPLVDATLSLGGMCTDPVSFNPFSKANPQKGTSSSLSVDVSTPPFACGSSHYDSRFVNIDMRQMGSLYKDNEASFQSHFTSSQDVGYWTNLAYPLFFKAQVRPEIPFSPTCPVPRGSLVHAERDLKVVSKIQGGLALVGIISDVLVSLPWILWACTRGFKTYNVKTATFLVKGLIVVSGNLLNLILTSVVFSVIWNLKPTFHSLIVNNCGDSESQAIFSGYLEQVYMTLWMDIVIFAWGLFEVGFELYRLITLPTEAQIRREKLFSKTTDLDLHSPKSVDFHSPIGSNLKPSESFELQAYPTIDLDPKETPEPQPEAPPPGSKKFYRNVY